jgi:hypothetical protein
MRHSRIETTMRYYIGQNAERTADELWAAIERQESRKVSIGVSTPQTGNSQAHEESRNS